MAEDIYPQERMKIHKISFKDHIQNWELAETNLDNLTLLVGASGVGKTKTLEAISIVQQIAFGGIQSGLEWNIEFTINNDLYNWYGKTDFSGDLLIYNKRMPFPKSDNSYRKPNFEIEKILLNKQEIINRTSSGTLYRGSPTVKFDPKESLISILKEEDLIKPIVAGFKQIYLHNHSSMYISDLSTSNIERKTNYTGISLEELQSMKMDITSKLYIASLFHKTIFEKIESRYCEIFPLVEYIEIVTTDFNELILLDIQIKEKGVLQWIHQSNISSGMYRVLIHIAEIYLCAPGSIFMIDEFENSLGVNCIDEVTNEILLSDKDIQFIITSHHPYIINNIDFSYWKLVTRKGSVVKTNPITNFIHGESSHDKFMQLIQLSQYQTGED